MHHHGGFELAIYAAADPTRERPSQDRAMASLDDGQALLAVADGAGGHNSGGQAATITIAAIERAAAGANRDGGALRHAILDALERAERAAPPESRYTDGILAICRGTAEMSIGAFRRGLELLERGIRVLEDGCANVQWECAAARSSAFNTLWWLGDIGAIRETAPPWIREGHQLGDLFTVVTAELYDALARLADDDPEGASRRADAAIAKWSQQGFHYQHWLAHKIQVWCALYRDDADEAQRRVDTVTPLLARSGLLGVELMRLDAAMLRGRVAMETARHAGLLGRTRALRRADRAARELERIDRPAAKAGAALLRGQIDRARGRSTGRRHLDEAVRGFDRAQTRMHALATRRLLAELGHGDLTEIDHGLRSAGVARPERWTSLYISR